MYYSCGRIIFILICLVIGNKINYLKRIHSRKVNVLTKLKDLQQNSCFSFFYKNIKGTCVILASLKSLVSIAQKEFFWQHLGAILWGAEDLDVDIMQHQIEYESHFKLHRIRIIWSRYRSGIITRKNFVSKHWTIV